MSQTNPQSVLYSFGVFQVDVREGLLFRKGMQVKIQEQPFRLLVALLQHPNRVVSKEELRRHLWSTDTFVEVDSSLTTAMAKLRDALGDDADNPRFVQTIAKRGYKFIAPVQVIGGEQVDSREVAAANPSLAPAGAPAAAPGRRWYALVAAAGLALAGAIGIAWHFAMRPAYGDQVVVLVGSFTNSTGDAVFDGTFRQASIAGLSQSPHLTVLSEESIRQGLQTLGRSPDEPLTAALEREVCQQKKAAALIQGTIRREGAGYRLAVDATRCSDGSELATETFPAATKEQVLPAVDRAVASLRRTFGESRETLAKYSTTVEEASTNSLEALKAYQLGLQLRSQGKNVEAIPVFKSATLLDDKFAIAYAQLGSCYSNQGETEEASIYFRKAFELRSRAIEPERLYIAGRYFDIITGELEKASETYRLWAESYPNQWRPRNALANDDVLLGRYDEAVSAAKQALALDPDQSFAYDNLAVALLALNRPDDAAAAARDAIARGHDDGFIHLTLYALAQSRGDSHSLQRQRQWATQFPDEPSVPYGEAENAEARGKLRDSEARFEKIAQRQIAAGVPGYAANLYAQEAFFELEMGRKSEAMSFVDKSLRTARTDNNRGACSLVYARNRDPKRAEALKGELDHDYPLSTFNMDVYSPMIAASLAADRGSSAREIKDLMRPAEPYELGSVADAFPVYVRGTCLLKVHAPKDAAQEFQKLLDHQGVDPLNPLIPLSYLGIARAYALQGRGAEARQNYDRLFEYWKDADENLKPLLQAREEYRALESRPASAKNGRP
jgi:eukaryotic-like serine/threonine-protein kinase